MVREGGGRGRYVRMWKGPGFERGEREDIVFVFLEDVCGIEKGGEG